MFLAKCDLDTAKSKCSSNLVIKKEQEGSKKKKDKVFLNIVTDSPEDAMKLHKGTVMCITTTVNPSYCPTEWDGSVFVTYSKPEEKPSTVKGVVPLLMLPEGTPNLRDLLNYCKANPEVRLVGGNLLEIPGLPIGRYADGKEKMGSVFNGVYDAFTEVDLSDIQVMEIMPKVRKVGTTKAVKMAKKSEKKKSSTAKKVETFQNLFNGCEVEF